MNMRRILLSLLVAMFMAGGMAWAGNAVNINSASAKELQKIDGIGAKTAAKIVAYRGEHGAFKDVEGLLKIKGFGKKKLEKVGDELTVDDGENDKGSDNH